jgi:alanine racemase
VVKADAYGHGLEAALAGFAEADGLALVEFDKAAQLRALGWSRPILMLEGAFDPGDTLQAAEQGLSLVVHEPRQVDWLGRLPPNASVPVHLKLNTGMNRLGFRPEEFTRANQRLQDLPSVAGVTVMTHFANADLDAGADHALACFNEVTGSVGLARSLANSAALISVPDSSGQWVRPGIMLYGASPFAERQAKALNLQPAMRLSTRLIAVQALQPGDAVGYGSTFIASKAMRIGIAACGYADGYPRHASTGTPVVVDGTIARTVGRVSMDMLAIDLQSVPQAGPGSDVELWGERLPIDEVASAAGTIGYELMCAVAPRVTRRVIAS